MATDASVVHRTGDESVGGAKTFSSNLVVSNSTGAATLASRSLLIAAQGFISSLGNEEREIGSSYELSSEIDDTITDEAINVADDVDNELISNTINLADVQSGTLSKSIGLSEDIDTNLDKDDIDVSDQSDLRLNKDDVEVAELEPSTISKNISVSDAVNTELNKGNIDVYDDATTEYDGKDVDVSDVIPMSIVNESITVSEEESVSLEESTYEVSLEYETGLDKEFVIADISSGIISKSVEVSDIQSNELEKDNIQTSEPIDPKIALKNKRLKLSEDVKATKLGRIVVSEEYKLNIDKSYDTSEVNDSQLEEKLVGGSLDNKEFENKSVETAITDDKVVIDKSIITSSKYDALLKSKSIESSDSRKKEILKNKEVLDKQESPKLEEKSVETYDVNKSVVEPKTIDLTSIAESNIEGFKDYKLAPIVAITKANLNDVDLGLAESIRLTPDGENICSNDEPVKGDDKKC
jgi:hypothetical protein